YHGRLGRRDQESRIDRSREQGRRAALGVHRQKARRIGGNAGRGEHLQGEKLSAATRRADGELQLCQVGEAGQIPSAFVLVEDPQRFDIHAAESDKIRRVRIDGDATLDEGQL